MQQRLCCFSGDRFSTVHSRYLIRGQNRYAKPMTEIPIKRNGQKSNARCSRLLRRLTLEFGNVSTAATRTGAKCMRHIDGLQDAIRTKNG
jgi:hypothetical protein